ncbi:hypothetical protein [Actinomadura sediminis]|uniref:Uncharacterized protein n=1 Tax=Actinomadura sediminis TaxID=1038904 RepID=A0ABW3ELT3_9ACTN
MTMRRLRLVLVATPIVILGLRTARTAVPARTFAAGRRDTWLPRFGTDAPPELRDAALALGPVRLRGTY